MIWNLNIGDVPGDTIIGVLLACSTSGLVFNRISGFDRFHVNYRVINSMK